MGRHLVSIVLSSNHKIRCFAGCGASSWKKRITCVSNLSPSPIKVRVAKISRKLQIAKRKTPSHRLPPLLNHLRPIGEFGIGRLRTQGKKPQLVPKAGCFISSFRPRVAKAHAIHVKLKGFIRLGTLAILILENWLSPKPTKQEVTAMDEVQKKNDLYRFLVLSPVLGRKNSWINWRTQKASLEGKCLAKQARTSWKKGKNIPNKNTESKRTNNCSQEE